MHKFQIEEPNGFSMMLEMEIEFVALLHGCNMNNSMMPPWSFMVVDLVYVALHTTYKSSVSFHRRLSHILSWQCNSLEYSMPWFQMLMKFDDSNSRFWGEGKHLRYTLGKKWVVTPKCGDQYKILYLDFFYYFPNMVMMSTTTHRAITLLI